MTKTYEEKGLGAVLNPPDNRDIPLALVQAPVALPKEHETDLSDFPVEDQKKNGSCVGQGEGKGIEYFDKKETGILTRVSKRYIYARSKAQDGYNGEGTYPRVAAKVLTDEGAPREELVGDNNDLPHAEFIKVDVTEPIRKDAYLRRVGGYAFVAKTAEDLKQAIYQNGVVSATLAVGKWNNLPVKPDPFRGWHRILIYGFKDRKRSGKNDTRFYFRNSWGKSWGDDGNGWFWWSDYESGNLINDIMAYADIPNQILEEARETNYIFTRDLERGMSGPDVEQLQRRLAEIPAKDGQPCFRGGAFDPHYGPLTEASVQRYQIVKGIVSSGTPKTTGFGRLGPKTRASLNAEKKAEELGLYPRVADLRDKLSAIMEAAGHPIYVTDEYRTIEEQNELYAKGRTKPGPIVTNARGGDSFHNWRCAFDIAFKKGSGITYEGPWDMVGKIGEIIGLEWGGKWQSFVDRPHFQLTLGYTLADFKAGRVDESRFGVPKSSIIKGVDYKSIIQTIMSKRVKSFFISAGSLLATALVAVVLTPEWASFVQDIYAWLQEAGLPASLVAVAGLIVAEIWKAILNKRTIANAKREFGVAAVERGVDLELY